MSIHPEEAYSALGILYRFWCEVINPARNQCLSYCSAETSHVNVNQLVTSCSISKKDTQRCSVQPLLIIRSTKGASKGRGHITQVSTV